MWGDPEVRERICIDVFADDLFGTLTFVQHPSFLWANAYLSAFLFSLNIFREPRDWMNRIPCL